MPKYLVRGTVNINWSYIVDAKNKQEAESEAIEYAKDGFYEAGEFVDEPEVTDVEIAKS